MTCAKIYHSKNYGAAQTQAMLMQGHLHLYQSLTEDALLILLAIWG